MECRAPQEIQEGDLLAYVEGTATSQVAAHVAECPFCQSEIRMLRKLEAQAAAALYRDSCPPTDDLLRYNAKMLPRKEARAVKAHVVTCDDCRSELTLLAAAEGLPAGPSLVERLTQAGQRVLRAMLQPSVPVPALAMRGGSARRLEYLAGDYQIVLALMPPIAGGNNWQIEGRISLRDVAEPALQDAAVLLLGETGQVATDSIDEFGFFALERLPGGAYQLHIERAEEQIAIEGIDLR